MVKRYVAEVFYRLREPIATRETVLPPLVADLQGTELVQVTVLPRIADGKVETVLCTAVYEGALEHFGWAYQPEDNGIEVHRAGTGWLMSPGWDCAQLLRSLLYQLSALTLQTRIYYPVDHHLDEAIASVMWIVPDGRRLPKIERHGVAGFFGVDTRATLERALTSADWLELEEAAQGRRRVPMWRSVLSDAHRAMESDMQSALIYGATALDVGLQPLLPPGARVNMSVLRGEEPKGTRTPDLRVHDATLYADVSQLWFSRHALVHRAEASLFDQNPVDPSATPIRRLSADDVVRFLRAVPSAVAFLEKYPP